MITIRAGFTLRFDCPQPTPMLLHAKIHPSRRRDLLNDEVLTFDPPLRAEPYVDPFDNACTRIVAPAGTTTLSTDFRIRDHGRPDPVFEEAAQVPVEKLPPEVIPYLFASRYCDSDRLADTAADLFLDTQPGWQRVQAICDYVHRRLAFDLDAASPWRSASACHTEGTGVCRDFAHLAIAFCRGLNIPARYCTGYLGDIGVPTGSGPTDFGAWFQVWLGDRWHTFDARHNTPRIGRILMATGRDAVDVALSTSFGRADVTAFEVVTEECATPAKLLRFSETGPALRPRSPAAAPRREARRPMLR